MLHVRAKGRPARFDKSPIHTYKGTFKTYEIRCQICTDIDTGSVESEKRWVLDSLEYDMVEAASKQSKSIGLDNT